MLQQEIFERSIALYAAYDSEAAELIRNASLKEYELYPTHAGEENLSRVFQGKDIFFHSPQGAMKEAENWFQALRLQGIDLLYIYGVGLGYYYDALKSWLHEDRRRFVVFLENDKSVLKTLFSTERGLEMLKDECVIIQTISFLNEFDMDLNRGLTDLFAALCNKMPLLSALQLYVEKREKALLAIKTQIYLSLSWQKIYHADKEALLGKITRNIIGNVLNTSHAASFSTVEGQFKGIPAIICGAGPSIIQEMDALKEARTKCLMIGSGTGTNVLNKHGIFPHFFVGLDPTETQETRIRMNNSYVIPCFHKLRFSSIASKILSGERVLIRGCESPFPTQWFETELGIDDTEEIETGISSTTFALSIAKKLGCNPIILVGLDLAYTDNKRYPDGLARVAFGNKALQDEITLKSKNLLIGKGYQGQEVLTKVEWLIESGIVSEFQKKHSDVLIVNATQKGLHINGVNNVILKEMLQLISLTDDLDGRLHALIQLKRLNVSPEKALDIVKRWSDHVRSFLNDLNNHESIEDLIEREDSNPFFKAFYPGYSELQRGYLFLPKMRRERAHVLGDQERYERYDKEYKETLFSFWKATGENHLDALLTESKKFEQETHPPFEQSKRGNFRAELPKCDGEYHGFCTYFGDDVALSKTYFDQGVINGLQEKYYLSGNLFSRQTYDKGLLEGPQNFFFEDGTPKASLDYHTGKLIGTVVLYYPNGKVKRKITFKEGIQHGIEQFWDESGTLLYMCEFKEGKPFGSVYEYYYNGHPLRKIVFDGFGKRVSLQEWDLAGNEVVINDEAPPNTLDMTHEQVLEAYVGDLNRLTWAFGDERRRLFL